MRLTPKTRRRRIALFSGNYVTVVDGVALTLNRLVHFLCGRGDEVVVFAPGAKRFALAPAGEFVPIPAVPFGLQPEYRVALGLTPRARRRLADLEPDLVHIATPDLLGASALRHARRWRLPVVGSFHSNIPSYLRYATFWRHFEAVAWTYLRRFYGRCDRVYVPTLSMKAELVRHGFAAATEIWARGVDMDRFAPRHRSMPWRRDHGIADDEPVVLFVARLRWEKGLDLLARVFRRLDDIGVRYRPVIVGDGVGYAPLRRLLPRAVMPGHLEGSALATAYASADVFLYPCETDTFGNVTLEAMASGLPTVCADAPGAKSLVQSGTTGWLVSPGDETGFVERTSSLIADAARRRRQGAAALERARMFSWDACLESLSNSYDDVLRRHKGSKILAEGGLRG